MIVRKLIFFSIITIVKSIHLRCYLCSQDTLPECAGSDQSDASLFTILQYYTEPCNGQCVLFRHENRSIVRGCSWTYGHMKLKTTGWHEISPGVRAYFCDRYLCNNGTYEQPEISRLIYPPVQTYLLATNNRLNIHMNYLKGHLLRQCYSCTARFQGCGEFLDPRYASKYIRPCPASCVIFRNPNDLNLITRDCAVFWPEVRVKTGFHKLLGTDAFFCQDSLCNGISFDFIMGIFHNQLPAVIRFPPIRTNEGLLPITTTTDIYNDSKIWDDPDLDETTTPIISSTEYLDTTFPDNNTTSDDLTVTKEDTSSILPIITFEYLSVNNSHEDVNHTDDSIFSSTPSIINILTFTHSNLLLNKKPLSISTIFQNSTITSTLTTNQTSDTLYDYCNNKQCYYNGRLNSDCLCICLPTFTGDNCETVLCEEEPRETCAFVLDYECQTTYIRYLCPKFCQLDICS